MKEAIIYLVVFIITMNAAFIGEKKNKSHQWRDKNEFHGRMISIAAALLVFIAFDVWVRYLFR